VRRLLLTRLGIVKKEPYRSCKESIMDSIHPPCEVQFVRREPVGGNTSSQHPIDASDNAGYYDDDDDDDDHNDNDHDGAEYYASDDDQSPLSSPPNSPLRLSPCSDDDDEEEERLDPSTKKKDGGAARLDLSALQLPAIAAENSTKPTTTNFIERSMDEPRLGPRLQFDSPDEELDGGFFHHHQGGGYHNGGGTMNRRAFSASALLDSQQHQRGGGGGRGQASAMGSSLSALDNKTAEVSTAAASSSSSLSLPRSRQQQRHNYHHSPADASGGAAAARYTSSASSSLLRDSKGGSFALPFEDEIDGPAIINSGSSTMALEGSGRSLMPAAINEFPSLDEDDDDYNGGGAEAAARFEIRAAPTDELPPLGSADLGLPRAVDILDSAEKYKESALCTNAPLDYDRSLNGERVNNNLPPLRPAAPASHKSVPESDAPEAASQAPPAVANSWMSFNLLKQRVIEAVSPLPPISTIVIEPAGDEDGGNLLFSPASPAGGEEPPSLSRSASTDLRPQLNVSLDDTSMHPLDERDELQQSAYENRPRQRSSLLDRNG
jgi:hypothetical protein